MPRRKLSRREFLKVTGAVGGGLLIGIQLGGCEEKPATTATDTVPPTPTPTTSDFNPKVWLTIAPDDSIRIRVASSEMGQGVMTSVPMLIAEELDADWSKVQAEFAPINPAFANPIFGRQQTGGSTAIRGYWNPLREVGAIARELLLGAAAQIWGVTANDCETNNGYVIHSGTGERLSYGELATLAATLPVPDAAFLKEPDEFKLLGKSQPRLDGPAKVDGSAEFGFDIQLPGLLTAMVVRCPVYGGRLKQFDATQAKAMDGVREVLAIKTGVAVVADHYWAAKQGRDALKIEWDYGPNAKLNSAAISKRFADVVDKGTIGRDDGNVNQTIKDATKTIEAVYEVPYLAHACMEPMNCTAHVRNGECDVWVPTQGQTRTHNTAMQLTGLPTEKVRVHTTFLGGGFGRRSEQDFVTDAIETSKAMDAPVKVVWTREDDIQHDYYRPATYNRLTATLNNQGMPSAWRHRIAGPSIFNRDAKGREDTGTDWSATEGALHLPYSIPNVQVSYAQVNTAVPVGFWRSVASSQNTYITECFLDEIAAAAGKDPYKLRHELLREQPRYRGVLELAANKAGWDRPPPAGHTRGIAVASSFGSYAAQVAEISIDRGRVRVHRVVCAIDCGMTVNPDTIEAQMESGIIYGLTAVLHGEINIAQGRAQQSNFNDYPLLSLEECPEIEVHIISSTEDPGGVGEPGTPPIAPAVANAVFAATGTPVRRLPIRLG